MNVLRYARGVSSIQTGSTEAANPYTPIAIVIPWWLSTNHCPKDDSATFLPKTTPRNMIVTPTIVASLIWPGLHLNM